MLKSYLNSYFSLFDEDIWGGVRFKSLFCIRVNAGPLILRTHHFLFQIGLKIMTLLEYNIIKGTIYEKIKKKRIPNKGVPFKRPKRTRNKVFKSENICKTKKKVKNWK